MMGMLNTLLASGQIRANGSKTKGALLHFGNKTV